MSHTTIARATLVAVICLAVLSLAALNPTRAGAAPSIWRVLAGGHSPDGAVESNAYHPAEFEIGIGDTVVWDIQGFHTVTVAGGGEVLPNLRVNEGQGKTSFDARAFAPFGPKTFDGSTTVSSGVPPLGPKGRLTFSLAFEKEGRWSYFCVIHGTRDMQGTVVVKKQPSATPAVVERRARASQAASLKAGAQAWTGASPERDGKTVVVPLLGSTTDRYSLLRFTRQPVVIRPGGTIRWEIRDVYEMHTITFPSGRPVPGFLVRGAQENVPQAINPEVVRPATGRTHDGTRFIHSGLLGPPVSGLPMDFALTFTRPGRYGYVCIVHPLYGMTGTVIVR